MLSASLFGILLGSTLIAPFGDRISRKRIVVWASVAYGVLSLCASAAWTIEQLFVLRLLIGMGLGSVVPNALTMAGEMFEERRQASITALVGIGITMGGALAGAVASWILPVYHWRGLFMVGGILPLAIAVIVALALKEQPRPDRPDLAETPEHAAMRRGVRGLFAEGGLGTTIILWVNFGAVALNLHLLSSWIPLLLKEMGLSAACAAGVTSTFHLGGVFGGIAASIALVRGGWRAIGLFALGAVLAILGLAFLSPGYAGTVALIVLAGFFVTGTQNAINGGCAAFYPVRLRATGLGWALGVARIGAIMGPLVGSAASLAGLDKEHRFFVIPAIPLALVLVLGLTVILAKRSAAAARPAGNAA